jgi:hypothetical protein
MMVGASEYSAAMAAYALIDNPPEIYTTPFWNVYPCDAIAYSNRQVPKRIATNIATEHSYTSSNSNLSKDSCRSVSSDHSYSLRDNPINNLMRRVRELGPQNMWEVEDEYVSQDDLEDVLFNHQPQLPN